MVEIAVKSVFGVKQASVVVLSVLFSSPFSEKYPNDSTGQPFLCVTHSIVREIAYV